MVKVKDRRAGLVSVVVMLVVVLEVVVEAVETVEGLEHVRVDKGREGRGIGRALCGRGDG